MGKQYFIEVYDLVSINQRGKRRFKQVMIEVSREVYLAHHHFENKEKYYQNTVMPERIEKVDYIGLEIADANWNKPHRSTKLIASLIIADISETINVKIDCEKQMERIIQAIDQLPEIQKRRFIQHHLERKSIGEIAEIEQVNPDTIRKSLRKAARNISLNW